MPINIDPYVRYNSRIAPVEDKPALEKETRKNKDSADKKVDHLSAEDKQLLAELSQLPPVLDSNLLNSAIFQRVMEAVQKMARSLKEMSTQLQAQAVQLRDKIRQEQIDAAKQEQKVSVGKAVTGFGITMGLNIAATGADKLKQYRAEKAIIKEHKTAGMDAEKLQALEAYAKTEAGKDRKLSKLSDPLRQLGTQGGAAAEAFFSAQEAEIKTMRADSDAGKTSQEMFQKQQDRAEGDYQEGRRRAAETVKDLVTLHAQAQQAASWRP